MNTPNYDSSSTDDSQGSGAVNLSRYQTNLSSDVQDGPMGKIDHQFATTDGEQADSVPPLAAAGFVTREAAYAATNAYTPMTATPATYGPPPGAIFGPPTTNSAGQMWTQQASTRSRGGSVNGTDLSPQNPIASAPPTPRPQRPTVGTRTPSSAYAPARRPSQFLLQTSNRHRSSSANRHRMSAEADYRAHKKLYVQRLQQGEMEETPGLAADYPPSLGYSTDTENEGDSPATDQYVDGDPYDQETLLYYDNEDMSPSPEELKVPANRERLEWHSMLANVLMGDVVKQEKKRMTGATEQAGSQYIRTELWIGVRAKTCGRPLAAQKRLVEDRRSRIPAMLEDIVAFEIKGEAEAGKPAKDQVEEIVKKIAKIEALYPSISTLQIANPRAASEAYTNVCNALVSWHNTTALINTELKILQTWVGNEELNFSKLRERDVNDNNLTDNACFIDRILKEDGLKSLQIFDENSLLVGVERVIQKSKATLMENAIVFADKHLPPYIEELLTLINFPSRLVQEIIRTRLSYAGRMGAQPGTLLVEQMISQFQILLTLAVRIKKAYIEISEPQPGWDLPPCLDENFDTVVLEALKYYFSMLAKKLSFNKNTFKEAEILEQEWDFANNLGRFFESGDTEVAVHFSSLTSKSLHRLTTHFEKELQRRPNEVAGAEMDKRYKQILDSVRVRQRKLFRFSRLLTTTFENTSEFSLNIPSEYIQEMVDKLVASGHILINTSQHSGRSIYHVASPSLLDRTQDIQSLLGTCYRVEDEEAEALADPMDSYILVLYPEEPIMWDGQRQEYDYKITPSTDMKPGKMRLVATGSKHRLRNAKFTFLQAIGANLDVVIPQRAHLPNVDKELQKIKRVAYKLSERIMDSVEMIRKQLVGLECQELIQSCFAFATEFGQRSLNYMDSNRRALNNLKLTRLALDWVSFICDDCVAADRKTFRWAVVSLEFATAMTRGQNILSISDEEYAKLRSKVGGCMSLLISHFDIMGARSTEAAQAEKQRMMDNLGSKFRLDISKLKDDEESSSIIRQGWMEQLAAIDEIRLARESEQRPMGRVLEDSNEADRSLTILSSAATNVTLRWQQGQFIGGGTFGSVYVAINLDSGILMAVKEIRLQDPQMIPKIVCQIRDEMNVLQILDHPNIVSYHGIEVHRDKVYIFMEYCDGGSLAGLLEHGRIEDEEVILVYTLQMLEGLAYLHEAGVVHRDIKPENILLDHKGVIKYVDFGAAKVIARQSGRTLAPSGSSFGAMGIGPSGDGDGLQPPRGRQRSMTGTPMYMSPETIRGNSAITGAAGPANTPGAASSSDRNGTSPLTPVSSSTSTSSISVSSSSTSTSAAAAAAAARQIQGAVDVWSLGCVITEMATGRRPWSTLDNEWAIMYNIANGNSPALPERSQLSDAGIEFLKRCFDRDPARRATAAELLQSDWLMTLRRQLDLEKSVSNAASSSTAVTTPGTESNASSSNGHGGSGSFSG